MVLKILICIQRSLGWFRRKEKKGYPRRIGRMFVSLKALGISGSKAKTGFNMRFVGKVGVEAVRRW